MADYVAFFWLLFLADVKDATTHPPDDPAHCHPLPHCHFPSSFLALMAMLIPIHLWLIIHFHGIEFIEFIWLREFESMLKTMKATKMRISRSLSNPLRTIGHIWPVFTVLYISLNISRSWLLFFKNNPIFDISGKFAIEWWYSFWFLGQNSLRKALLKMTKISKKLRFFENLIVLKGLIEYPNLRKALKNVWKCKI